MPKGYKPTVFVSSTCYDLSQIRADLRDFIESLGMEPMLSEYASFPMNPDHDTVKNCIENVKHRGDILVLLVGGRYGFQTDQGKSVTNVEYLEAKAKDIPVYIFIARAVWDTLKIWRKNPDADYSDIVDSTKVFEFVSDLTSGANNWIYQFDKAQDIIPVLKKQFGYLFMDVLEARRALKGTPLDNELATLGANALELVVQKPMAWEYRLFAQVLRDEIEVCRYLKYDLEYGIAFGDSTQIQEFSELCFWIRKKTTIARKCFEALTTLINSGLREAVGKQGEDGVAEKIVYVSRRVAQCYREMIDWSLDFKRLCIDSKFINLVNLASKMSDNIIQEVEEFSKQAMILSEPSYVAECVAKERSIELTVDLTIPDMTEYEQELERLGLEYM